jgi:hypothetical protein
MPRGAPFFAVLPFVPFVAGFALSAWRFRAHDAVGGLAFGLGGVLLMVVVVLRMPGATAR